MSFNPYLAFSASAGSGKTFALAVRYVSLLFMGESPGSILAATFANKAASEMRQRVIESLRGIHKESNKSFADAVCVQVGLSYAELLEKQDAVLKTFLSSTPYIVTLDSFFSAILRSSSLEIGLEPDFVTKEQGEGELEYHFLGEIEAAGLFSSLVRLSVNIEDKRFTKIFELMQNFYRADSLLPDKKADAPSVKEQEEKCESIRKKILEALSNAGAPGRCLGLFDTDSIKSLYEKELFKNEILGEHPWFKKVGTEEVEFLYALLKKELSAWAQYKEMSTLADLFELYSYYKNANISNAKQSNVFTFDDLTYFTYRLLHESVSKEFLYFKIDSKFKHILLDEFQDTSTLQFLLLQPLIDEVFAGKGQNEFRSFFYVGDTKQSLYRFRGGVEELFGKVAENYGMKIEQMDTNYRSSKNVIAQVNQWFQDPVMEGYVPQKSKADAPEGYVEVIESDLIIEDAISQAERLIENGIDINDIAFLVSTNKDGQTLQEACEAKGIDTLLKTSSSLRSVPRIAAISAMLSYFYTNDKIDAEAMLSRIGKSLDEVDTKWFSPFMSPVKIISRLVAEFGYFDNDLNILKLLEFASSYSTLPSFLEEFNTSRISVASNSVHGAKIMTVHGAKGLEFDHVILLDKLTGPNNDKAVLMFDYGEDLHVSNLYYRTKGRANFDEDYASFMERREDLNGKDAMNVLYVALTRAAIGLTVIRKTKASVFDRLGVGVIAVGAIASPVILKTEPLSPGRCIEEKVSISSYGPQNVEKKDEDEEAKDYEALLFGTALHYALEMLADFASENIAICMTALSNKFGQKISAEQIKEIQKRIMMLIEHEEFKLILEGSTVRREQALSYEGELKQIDLLLEYDDRNVVIDYKSSTKYASKHLEQVSYYQKAIDSITGKATDGYIVYVLEDKIVLTKV